MGHAGANPRQITRWHLLGIVLAPYIFGWALLRRGYSIKARAWTFVWMFVAILIGLSGHNATESASHISGKGTFKTAWAFSADHKVGNAELHSNDTHHFSAGFIGSRLYVHAYKSADGYSVSLEAKHGVFSCGNNDDIYVSFDGKPIEAFTCHETQEETEAMTSGPVFLDAPDDFVERMNTAKTMSVQPLFIGDGRKDYWFTALN